jgi:hypothetical protein
VAVGSHVIFLKLRKKELLASRKAEQIHKNDNYFRSKQQPRTILSEKRLSTCEFAQLCKQFFLFQHEKNHVTQLTTAKN